jgi:vancomycin resistance protein VanW
VYDERIRIARADESAHPLLEEGKLVNLALAAPSFDGIVVAPHRPLSFWRALGRVTASRGFRYGMELRAGCIVPALGGGLCLLSNALFEMAARLDWQILERHAHSMDAGLPVHGMWGLDATVLWPHVDLRIAPRRGSARLSVRVADGDLALTVHADMVADRAVALRAEEIRGAAPFRANRIVRSVGAREEVIAINRKRVLVAAEAKRSCLACGETSCKDRVVPRRA